MVGGGRGAFIGTVHRMAAAIDNEIELVCGAFSSDPQKSKDSGKDWYVDEDRSYGSYQEMFDAEKAREDGMDFVCIATPNHMHFPVAKAALEAGINVMSDKPATFNSAEARDLRELVNSSGLLYGLTHNYTGYPLVKEARHIVASGGIGKVRKIVVEYPQGWLATNLEADDQKQAAWRTDPARAGSSCCMGDIGTHAENLAEYITGEEIDELACEFTSFVDGRVLEDDGNCLVRYKSGAKGILYASQISVDEENGLAIRVHGETGGLYWRQDDPNTLIRAYADRYREVIRPGGNYADRLSPAAAAACRIPAGHPEGYLEAFAVLYRNYANTLRKRLNGEEPNEIDLDFPTIDDGVRGMAFIDACVESAKNNAAWTKLED
ncbi:MAG: Gfo/Idh/MocA family oxidoreductase [Lentisphaeria bacterium]|nr:Gfo/Idh/MocA family oxidoreductase [Lentisphaeria bacterium]